MLLGLSRLLGCVDMAEEKLEEQMAMFHSQVIDDEKHKKFSL